MLRASQRGAGGVVLCVLFFHRVKSGVGRESEVDVLVLRTR